MIPILTPDEMAAVDKAASTPVQTLIRRAATEVARSAIDLLGGSYGRRVTVVAGKGNNGNDGRVAAGILRRRGIRVCVVEAAELRDGPPPAELSADLVIDAAFGTGFRGTWSPPPLHTPVLAVDIPSGIDGLTGVACGAPWHAVRTVTFAALKPGLLLADGPSCAGEVTVADIGLDASSARAHLVEDPDVIMWVSPRRDDDHKWRHAVRVVAGSPGMHGAGWLSARAAMRGGAGYVRSSSPGIGEPECPREAVGTALAAHGWAPQVLEDLERFGAAVVGPGLGLDAGLRAELEELLAGSTVPMVLDGDALRAWGRQPLTAAAPVVLTPHDGEFTALTGSPPAADRFAAVRAAAADHRSVVLLKGPTTLVAEPDGRVLATRSGDARLATAGSGDVLSGLIGAHLAAGTRPVRAAAAAAHLHGLAGRLAGAQGVVAGDIAEALGDARELLWGCSHVLT